MAIAVRPAQPSELDEILSIWLETQPLMPLWNYRYSHYREFPEDFHSYDRQWLADQLADSSKTFIVAETRDAPGTNAKTVVAASLWWMQGPKPWSTYRKGLLQTLLRLPTYTVAEEGLPRSQNPDPRSQTPPAET